MSLSREDQINKIMDWFDFGRVHRCMKHLGWTWTSTNGVPEEGEIRSMARDLMRHAVGQCDSAGLERQSSGTGGFKVTVDKESVSLQFVLADWSADSSEDEVSPVF